MVPPVDAEACRRAAWRELVFDVARSSGEVRLKVSGASMLPVAWPGDVVTVRRCELADLHPGQIVLFGQKEKLTVHRVTHVAGDYLIARGDSLPCCDPPVSASEIVGQVMSIVRNGRLIPPDPSFWQRIVASILRHSGPCRRILLLADAILLRLEELRLPWASSRPPLPPCL
jgi:signal peptidase I